MTTNKIIVLFVLIYIVRFLITIAVEYQAGYLIKTRYRKRIPAGLLNFCLCSLVATSVFFFALYALGMFRDFNMKSGLAGIFYGMLMYALISSQTKR